MIMTMPLPVSALGVVSSYPAFLFPSLLPPNEMGSAAVAFITPRQVLSYVVVHAHVVVALINTLVNGR